VRGAFIALAVAAFLAGSVTIEAAAGAAAPGKSPIEHQPIVAPIWKPHVEQARRYARHRAGGVAFAFIDWWGHMHRFHASRTFPTASVIKVMLLVAYLRQPGVRHRRLHRADRALLRPMIRRSDNYAATAVRNIVGRARIERLARRARMRDFRYSAVWGLSRTSPRDQARFMYRLERYIPRRHRDFALRQLAHVVGWQRWGIGKVEPSGWALYFKGGWGGGTGWMDHQVALLKRNSLRMSLAVFTSFDPSHAYGKQTLRGVAARLLRGLPP
jgi:hypothetical protein